LKFGSLVKKATPAFFNDHGQQEYTEFNLKIEKQIQAEEKGKYNQKLFSGLNHFSDFRPYEDTAFICLFVIAVFYFSLHHAAWGQKDGSKVR
jgi:hypothetical protein